MPEYSSPKDLYFRIEEIPGQGVKLEVYQRIEDEEIKVIHAKRVGLIWLKENERTLEGIVKRLNDRPGWECPS